MSAEDAADEANRHAARDRLSVDDHVGADAEVLLRTARSEPEARVDLVENQRHATRVAHLAQVSEPSRVLLGRFLRAPHLARHQHRVIRWRGIRMERLNRVDEHSGDLPRTQLDDGQRCRVQILQRQTVVDRALAAEAGLHAIPPSVVGARKADDEPAARVESRKTHRRHDRFGTAHVKRHLVEAGNVLQHRDVLGHERMQRPEDGPEILHALPSTFDPFLVPIEAGDVEPVRAAHIERPVAVQILQVRATRCRDDGAQVEPVTNDLDERKRNACGIRKAEVGQARADRVAPFDRARVLPAEGSRKAVEPPPAPLHACVARAIGPKHACFVVAPGAQPRGQPPGHRGHPGLGSQRRDDCQNAPDSQRHEASCSNPSCSSSASTRDVCVTRSLENLSTMAPQSADNACSRARRRVRCQGARPGLCSRR